MSGIGTQNEKTLHAFLKNYVEPDQAYQEVPVGPYIADILNSEGITEVQTANFGQLRDKLDAFLPHYPVQIVFPIPHEKWIIWIDPKTGERLARNRSPRKGTFYHAFKELYRIRRFLGDENLSIRLMLIDMDEYRLLDGWSRDKKRGSHRLDRIPLGIFDEMVLSSAQDYKKLIPSDLPQPFTNAQFARSVRFYKSGFSHVTQILAEQGVLVRAGKSGNSILYRSAGCGDSRIPQKEK